MLGISQIAMGNQDFFECALLLFPSDANLAKKTELPQNSMKDGNKISAKMRSECVVPVRTALLELQQVGQRCSIGLDTETP